MTKTGLAPKWIGNRSFYRMVLGVTLPIMLQNGITNFVSLLDNVMVGRVGTEQMSGVSIVNQLIFIFFLCIFGGFGGIGIFTAQYYGKGDEEGIRCTFRAKLWLGAVLTVLAIVVLRAFGPELIGLYLNEGSEHADLESTLGYALGYMDIIFFSLPAFALLQVYASTLRASGETVVPMKAGVAAVLVNLTFNYLLIYGKWIFPEMGVNGAAVATVLSRYVEMTILMVWTHTHAEQHPFIQGVYRTMSIPARQLRSFAAKGTPLLINEALWSVGMSVLLQCYSMRGLEVVAAMNITNTISNLFSVIFFAMGDAVSIIVGQLLGAGKLDEARDTDTKLFAFGISFSLLAAALMYAVSWAFPEIYNTGASVKQLATALIHCYACFMPVFSFCHCAYFTLRTGGRTIVTFLFDSVFTWTVSVPIAFVLSRFTSMDMIPIYICVTAADLVKCVVGYILVKRGVWLNNIVSEL